MVRVKRPVIADIPLELPAGSLEEKMPAAISIDPPDATAWDLITLTFDANIACNSEGEGDLTGFVSIAMHAGAVLETDDQNNWGSLQVNWNDTLAGGYSNILTNNGDNTYSITFIPAVYFGATEGSVITQITAVFNNGFDWANTGRDNVGGLCIDFIIPFNHGNYISTIANNGSYLVDVPYHIPNGEDYRIKLISAINPSIYAYSDYFTIAEPPVINNFPYSQDFENVSYWYSAGQNSSWEMGLPSAEQINHAASGENAWVTNLYGAHNTDELSWIESPLFDFSSLNNPVIELSI